MAVDHEQYAFSFSHAVIKANDKQYTAISNVSFSQDIDRSAVYGTSRNPLKRSAGQLQMGDATVTFSDLEEAMTFISDLGEDPSLALFSCDVTLANDSGQVRSFELLSCALNGFSASFEAGADALSLEIPMSFLRLKIDGREFAR
jgi:hypothetical protein